MEYILAAIFSSNRILYNFADVDLFYIFSGALLIFYIYRRRRASMEILKLSGIFLAYTLLSFFIAVDKNLMASSGFMIAMVFNITLLVYIVRDRYKWSMLKWSLIMTVIHGIETLVAVILKNKALISSDEMADAATNALNHGKALIFNGSSLWEVKHYGEVTSQKLRLFYHEPIMLCCVSGVLLIYFIYKLVTDGISLQIVMGAIIALIDMYYSFSLSGIIAAAVAIAVLLAVNILQIARGQQLVLDKDAMNRGAYRYGRSIVTSVRNSVRWTIAIVSVGIIGVVVLLNSPIYKVRFISLLQGTDVSLNYTVIEPFRNMAETLKATLGRGAGIGSNLDIMNSYLRVMTEGGVLGILLIAAIAVSLVVLCVRYGGALDAALMIYVVLIQFTAGEFTNPINWFIYGWIIADCFGKKELCKQEEESKANKSNDQEDDVPVTVGIIGAKGFANYGGYETFIDKLTEYHKDNKKINYLVACKANGQGGVDESKLEGAVAINERKFKYHNAYCFKIKVPQVGSGQAIIYDLLSAVYIINYFKRHRVEKPILYVLTCRIGPFMRWISGAVHDLGGVYFLNPDGHEFLRAYWSRPVRAYWKYSEKLMVKYADKVICDSKNIETYISAGYEQYNPNTTYIPYGTDLNSSILTNNDPKFREWMDANNIKEKEYYLIVGRFVPENNYEVMLREFVNSSTDKDLVIVTNCDNNPDFLDELDKRTGFRDDKRVKFVGTVYDKELLKKIREEAYAYIHGHEVGGTNPSLIEALYSTKLNILLNVGFNRECGEEGALYFSKDEGELAEVIEIADGMGADEVEELHQMALKRIYKDYTWEKVTAKYEKLFMRKGLFRKVV